MKKLLLLTLFSAAMVFQAMAATIQLAWNAPNDPTVTGYKVYRSVGSSAFSLIGNSSTLSFSIAVDTNQISVYYVTSVNSTGAESVPSQTVTNTPAPPQSNLPLLVYMNYEAESGITTSPMTVSTDVNASNGKYIQSTVNESGTEKFTVNIPYSDNYIIWCRVVFASGGTDSFYVSVDNGIEDIFGGNTLTWVPNWIWIQLNGGNGTVIPKVFYLSSGSHTLLFRGRELGTKLDKFVITNDRNVTTTSKILNP